MESHDHGQDGSGRRRNFAKGSRLEGRRRHFAHVRSKHGLDMAIDALTLEQATLFRQAGLA